MRDLPSDFVPGFRLPETLPAGTRVFAFSRRRLLLRRDAETARPPRLDELAVVEEAVVRRQYLGALASEPVVSAELPDDAEPPEGFELVGLRGLFPLLPGPDLALAGLAVQVVAWDRDHQFCGRCGEPVEPHGEERSKRCEPCGVTAYPRLAPAVIVLVERGDEVLLARSPHFPPGMYSTLAGFVEPGESLERTVEREIHEEVGVRVHNIRYFGSQPWPFPNSLMLGFHADWKSGDITLADPEIEDARWYPRDALPRIPPRVSIARQLIEAYLAERG